MKTTLYLLSSLFLLFSVSCGNRAKLFNEYQDKILAITHSEKMPQEKAKALNTLLKEISNSETIKNKKDRAKLAAICFTNIGWQYEAMGKYDLALNYQDRSIEADSTNGKLYYNRGVIYNKLQRMDEAEADYKHSLKLLPNLALAYNNLGVIYQGHHKNYDKAIECFNKSIELDPNFIEGYGNRAGIYSEKGEYGKAIKDNNFVLSKDPHNLKAYIERAIVYTKMKQYDKAFADYESALKIDSLNPYVYYNRGAVYSDMKEYGKALADFKKTSDVDSTGRVGKWARKRIIDMLVE